MKETGLTSRYAESHFSRLFANKGSGGKLTQHEIMGVVNKLDALLVLMRTPDKGFTIVESSRKRKWTEGADEGWNRDGDDEDEEGGAMGEVDEVYEAASRKTAKGYTVGFTSTRHQNSKHKFTMVAIEGGR
jgi:hypothetical protein